VDVFGADASLENTDVFFDHCLKVVHHIYTSLQLHGKYVCFSFRVFVYCNCFSKLILLLF